MFETPLPALSLAVVGVEFDNSDGSNRCYALAMCNVGDPIDLRLEPNNPADENAVAVHNPAGMQIGYITSVRAVRISALIREGRELRAVFQRPTDFGAWIRVAFDGETPALTPSMTEDSEAPRRSKKAMDPASQVSDDEPDFYPDEVWPDD